MIYSIYCGNEDTSLSVHDVDSCVSIVCSQHASGPTARLDVPWPTVSRWVVLIMDTVALKPDSIELLWPKLTLMSSKTPGCLFVVWN